jgi:hypothetical protein
VNRLLLMVFSFRAIAILLTAKPAG